jgi:hypothetical protein
MIMNKQILAIILGILLIALNVPAQDVTIDGSGNVTTGTSNTNANLEVTGESGEDGIVGSASSIGRSGVYGINSSNNSYGTLGHSDYGVYGNSTGTAGFFQGNAEVTGNLTVGGNISGNIVEADPNVNALGKASLACSEGQVAKFIGASWACGNDIDTDTNTQLSESAVETYITNGPINLNSGTTIGGVGIAAVNHTHPAGGSYGGVTVVAVSGGDYFDPVTAIGDISTWCGVPSETNPCLLKIMPGRYDIGGSSLQMESYIDIEGSGENVTKITGSVDSLTAGIVNGADNAEIRFLTVENTNTGNDVNAIYNSGGSPKITNVTARVTGGYFGRGIYNNSSNAIINNVTVYVSGSGFSFGIENSSSSPVINNASVTASGSSDGYGMYSYFASKVAITNSRMNGSTASITTDAKTMVFNSQLVGVVSAPPSTVTCAGVFDASYTFFASTCP